MALCALPTAIALLLAGGLTAFAAEADLAGLEAARSELSRTRTEVARLQGVQAVLRGELRQLAAEIEQNKQQGERDGLEERLRRNQELSYRLSTLARELSTAEGRAEAARSGLSGALSIGLDSLQTRWEATLDRASRQNLLTLMQALRVEREGLRANWVTSELGGEPLRALAERQTSDDPRELMEQADALRDAEDKMRSRLQQLDLRIAEARQERELDRRMGQFLGEEPPAQAPLGDAPERRLRVRVGSAPAVAPFTETVLDAGGERGGAIALLPAVGPTPFELPSSEEIPELADYSHLRLLEGQRAELKAAADQLRARAVEHELRAHQLK